MSARVTTPVQAHRRHVANMTFEGFVAAFAASASASVGVVSILFQSLWVASVTRCAGAWSYRRSWRR